MKALTLWQPWAGAMAAGVKEIETRGRRFNYRGPLAIHAAAREPTEDENDIVVPFVAGNVNHVLLCTTRSAILAVVDVYECLRTETINDSLVGGCISRTERALGNYSPGRFGILTRNLRVLRHPVPCKGKQGLWNLTPELEAAVLAELP